MHCTANLWVISDKEDPLRVLLGQQETTKPGLCLRNLASLLELSQRFWFLGGGSGFTQKITLSSASSQPSESHIGLWRSCGSLLEHI